MLAGHDAAPVQPGRNAPAAAAEARPVATLGPISDAERKDVLAQLRDWSGLEPARGGESMTAV